MANNDTYQMVTEKIISLLEKGVAPWRMPWVEGKALAWSGVDGHAYSIINQFLLMAHSTAHTFAEMVEDIKGEWLTFNQIKSRGGMVKKGEHGRKVIFFKPYVVKDDEGNEKTIPLLASYTVFHIRQTMGIEQKYHKAVEVSEYTPDELAENVIADYLKRSGVGFRNDGDRAFYSPKSDSVVVPAPEKHFSTAEYYSTVFHELAHSTGHESRLARITCDAYHREEYSLEELVAEIASASICASLGIDTESTLENSAAYIQGWLKALRDDKHMIVRAASRAEKAVKMILNA